MTRSRIIRLRSRTCLGALLLTLLPLWVSAASPRRVLVLNPFGHDVAPFSLVIAAFRTTLARELGEPVDFHEVPLDLARFAGPEGEGPLVAFLRDRIRSQRVDLVVSMGGAGVQFAGRHRESLFPNIPVLAVGADPRLLPPGFLRTNATLVTQRVHLPGIMDDILQLRPRTTNIAVVFGASPLEQFWVEECRREFRPFTNRVGFTWLNDLPLEKILERCATLPPGSFIFHGLFVADATGIPCERNEALRRLHEVANAPLFGYLASGFGLGSIGGRLYQDSEVGEQGARVAIRILRGERPEDIAPRILEATTPVFDWRELRRWGISEARLPAGSVVRFRQPGPWELYRWPVAAAASFCLLQAALIVGLGLSWAKRRQGEAESALIADISSKFVNLPAAEVDREILDAERRLCGILRLDLAALWQRSDDDPDSFTLTHLYRAQDGAQLPKPMNAREHFPWYQQQMLAGRIVAVTSLDELPPEAARDRDHCRRLGIRSNLSLPLSVGGAPPIGILGLNTLRSDRRWSEALVKRLQLVAQIFANALARKRADQALREGDRRMTLAAEAAEFGVWVWNIGPDQVWGSERWLRLFGFSAEEEIGFERNLQRIHPDDRPKVEQDVRRALANGTDYAGEFRAVLPDGTLRWIAARGRIDPDANGTAGRMMGAALDITERKRSETALHDLSRRLIRAHEEERARLGRELHDDVTQRLARLAIDAARAEGGAAELSPTATLRALRDGLVRLSEDIHALSYRLHPSVLEDLGLAEALKAECERFSRQESIPATVTLQGLPDVVPPETALCLFRVAQEALRNAARHARARAVEISVRKLDGGLQMVVLDDGIGFDPALQLDRPSLGLASMRERVLLLDGEFDLESASGKGTTILAWVPVGKAKG